MTIRVCLIFVSVISLQKGNGDIQESMN